MPWTNLPYGIVMIMVENIGKARKLATFPFVFALSINLIVIMVDTGARVGVARDKLLALGPIRKGLTH